MGEREEYNLLPPELKWRFQLLKPDNYDFSWLREWRIPVKEINISQIECFVVADTKQDIEWLYNLIFDLDDIDAQPEEGMIQVEYLGYFISKYKIVSIEEIENVNSMSKIDLEKILREQLDEEARLMH